MRTKPLSLVVASLLLVSSLNATNWIRKKGEKVEWEKSSNDDLRVYRSLSIIKSNDDNCHIWEGDRALTFNLEQLAKDVESDGYEFDVNNLYIDGASYAAIDFLDTWTQAWFDHEGSYDIPPLNGYNWSSKEVSFCVGGSILFKHPLEYTLGQRGVYLWYDTSAKKRAEFMKFLKTLYKSPKVCSFDLTKPSTAKNELFRKIGFVFYNRIGAKTSSYEDGDSIPVTGKVNEKDETISVIPENSEEFNAVTLSYGEIVEVLREQDEHAGEVNANIKLVTASKQSESDYQNILTVTPGEELKVRVTFDNKGDKTAHNAQIHFYIDGGKKLNIGDDEDWVAEDTNEIQGHLDPGEVAHVRVQHIKAPEKEGRYWLHVCVWHDNEDDELDMNNNCSNRMRERVKLYVDKSTPRPTPTPTPRPTPTSRPTPTPKPKLKADLVIQSVYISRVTEKSPFEISYVLKNNGKKAVTDRICTVGKVYDKTGREMFNKEDCTDSDIPVGKTLYRKVSTGVVEGMIAGGGYKAELHTNPRNEIEESNYSNNKIPRVFYVNPKPVPKPDIVVDSIWFSKIANEGKWTQIKYKTKNNGSSAIVGRICDRIDVIRNGAYVSYFNNCYTEGVFGRHHVREKTFDFVSPKDAGNYKLSIKADFYNNSEETNEANNQKIIDFAVFGPKPIESYRYYHRGLHAHLFTSNYNVPNGWSYAGRSFKVFATQKSGTVPVYACWHDRDRTHRYSRSWSEAKQNCSENPWVAFYAYPNAGAGRKPVRELWHPSLRVYIYSNGEGDANKLHDRFGFQKKSVMWYSPN